MVTAAILAKQRRLILQARLRVQAVVVVALQQTRPMHCWTCPETAEVRRCFQPWMDCSIRDAAAFLGRPLKMDWMPRVRAVVAAAANPVRLFLLCSV